MINYIIRVVYASADADSYERLSAELAKYNVAGAIKADDGKGYYLPQGEYCYSGNEPVNEVRDAIHRFAATIKSGVSVLVMEISTVSWSGLTPIDG